MLWAGPADGPMDWPEYWLVVVDAAQTAGVRSTEAAKATRPTIAACGFFSHARTSPMTPRPIATGSVHVRKPLNCDVR